MERLVTSTDVERNYKKLKESALNSYKKNERDKIIINSLKNSYESIINSPRRFSDINDLQSLLLLLEKRDVLNALSIKSLNHVYLVLGLSTEKLYEHNLLIADFQRCTSIVDQEYSDVNIEYQSPINHSINLNQNRDGPFESSGYHPVGSLSQRDRNIENQFSPHCLTNFNQDQIHQPVGLLSEKVVKIISSRIGCYWKSLARFLNVQEYRINEIVRDNRLQSNEARAIMMLQEYQNITHPDGLKKNLLTALKLADRIDLHDKIQEEFIG